MDINKEDFNQLKKEIKADFSILFDRIADIDKKFTTHSELTQERLRLGNERFEKTEQEIKILRMDLLDHIKNNIQNESVIIFIDKNKDIMENMFKWYNEKIETGKQIKKEINANLIKYFFMGAVGIVALIPVGEKILKGIGIIK